MSELKVFKIRKKLTDLCDFTVDTIKLTELVYIDGLNKDTALKEISEIRNQIRSSDKFTLAFVGEYNAGKTSIINILTGNNFSVSSTVATQDANEIQWKDNLTIIDTPGLGSGLTEHDEITSKWLSKADLLVYVLTPDLFNSHSGERFLTMLEKYKRNNELMLVMNMIDQEGNEIDIYQDALRSVIAPKSLDEFFPTFISAKYKEYSKDSTLDDEERAYYLEKCRFDSFLEMLDNFIMDKKEKASLTTPLTRLHTLLHKIGFKNKFDQENNLLDLKIRNYEKHLGSIKMEFSDFQSRLNDYALGAAGEIFRALDSPPSDFQQFCQGKFDDFGRQIESTIESLTERISSIVDELEKDGEKIDGSALAKEVNCRIADSEILQKLFQISISGNGKDGIMNEQILQAVKSQLKYLDGTDISGVKLSGDFAESVFSSTNIFQAGSKLIGKVDKGIVTKIGHKLGKKFKPWEAVKLTSKIGKAVPILNVAGAIWETTTAIREKHKKEEANRQLSEFKSEIKRCLDEAVNKTTNEINQKMLKAVETSLISVHKMLQDKKKELIEYSEGNKQICKQLEYKKRECLGLYDDIYET